MTVCIAVPSPGAVGPGEGSPITIAALPFAESSADGSFAPLATAIGDILVARFSDAEGVVFVERAAIDEVLRELELSTAVGAADQCRFGKTLGAQFVLTGNVTLAGNTIVVAAHLVEVSTARVARSAKVTAREGHLFESVESLARELAGQFRLQLPELTPDQIDRSPEANLHFMRGLGYYHAGMPEHATTQFLKTLATDPGHAEARFYNGMNYLRLAGESDHAKLELVRFLREFGDHRLAARATEALRQCGTRPDNPTEGERP